MLARQFSSHTSYPCSISASTKVVRTGARKILARTPAPCTTRTGPLVGGVVPCTWIRLHESPSPAVNGTRRSRNGGFVSGSGMARSATVSVRAAACLDDPIGGPTREGGDRQGRIGSDRPRHDGAVYHVQVRMIEHLAIAVHDALLLIASHRHATQRM